MDQVLRNKAMDEWLKFEKYSHEHQTTLIYDYLRFFCDYRAV